jgi:hypothetical protein
VERTKDDEEEGHLQSEPLSAGGHGIGRHREIVGVNQYVGVDKHEHLDNLIMATFSGYVQRCGASLIPGICKSPFTGMQFTPGPAGSALRL